MRLRLPSSPLWRDRDFLLLWGSLIAGDAGMQVTTLAVTSVAILVLHAGAFEVGLVGAATWLPWAFLALPAGVLSDRIRKRQLLLWSCFGRAAVLAMIPLAFALQVLSIRLLLLVTLLEGALNVIYSITSTSYVPALVGKDRLLDANSKIFTSRSLASLGAPAFGGYLVQAIGAAFTVWASAAAFVAGGVMTLLVRTPESLPQREAHHAAGFVAEAREGFEVVFGNPTLKLLVIALGVGGFGGFGVQAIQLLYFYEQLHLSPATVGFVLAMEGVGSIAGALIAQAAARRFGLGPTLIATNAVWGLSILMTPLAGFGNPVLVLALLMVAFGLTGVVFDVNQISMRQGITPDRLQGRMTATIRMVILGIAPIGAFLGGVLGSRIGLVPTIILGGTVVISSIAWLLPRPIRSYSAEPAR